MKTCYVPKKFTRQHMQVINLANGILQEYAAQRISITLRSLYYQFVARGLLPNKQRWYKWLGGIVGDARLAGLIDWEHLEDRVRNLSVLQHFDGPQDALDKLTAWYHVDMWRHQRWRPEVWIEKDALAGVIVNVCQENDVPYFVCRGYTSLSEMWRASLRLRRWSSEGQKPYIIHFGDHDPSGIDMSRDILDRTTKTFMADCEFDRVALNMDQIEEHSPPPNPAKVTDSRYKDYREKFGEESWELDALDPPLFRGLIESQLDRIRNQEQWDKDAVEADKVREQLRVLSRDWESLNNWKVRSAKLTEVVEAARKGGWEGKDDGKLLGLHVGHLADSNKRLGDENERLLKELEDAKRAIKNGKRKTK